MAGTVTPLMVTPLLKSRSLASGETFRAMRSSDRMVGVSCSLMPNSLYWMAMLPSRAGTGIGSSPPARKLAFWPVCASRVGRASTRAMPLPSRMLSCVTMPAPLKALPKVITRLMALAMADEVLLDTPPEPVPPVPPEPVLPVPVPVPVPLVLVLMLPTTPGLKLPKLKPWLLRPPL